MGGYVHTIRNPGVRIPIFGVLGQLTGNSWWRLSLAINGFSAELQWLSRNGLYGTKFHHQYTPDSRNGPYGTRFHHQYHPTCIRIFYTLFGVSPGRSLYIQCLSTHEEELRYEHSSRWKILDVGSGNILGFCHFSPGRPRDVPAPTVRLPEKGWGLLGFLGQKLKTLQTYTMGASRVCQRDCSGCERDWSERDWSDRNCSGVQMECPTPDRVTMSVPRSRLRPAIRVCSLPRSVNHVFPESLHIGRIPPYGDQKSIETEWFTNRVIHKSRE